MSDGVVNVATGDGEGEGEQQVRPVGLVEAGKNQVRAEMEL